LVQQATGLFNDGKASLEQLFPSTIVWMEELSFFLRDPPNHSLSLTSSLGGAYFLVEKSPANKTFKPRRDKRGQSIPARMAIYTTRILDSKLDLSTVPQNLKVELLYLLYLVVELAGDQLTTMEDNKLWAKITDTKTTSEVQEFISSAQRILNVTVIEAGDWNESGESLVDALINLMLQQTKDLSPMSLYSAKAISNLLQQMTEAHGFPATAESKFIKLEVMKATPNNIFSAIALITGFGEALVSSKTINRLCNGLVSDIAGAFPTSPRTLMSMVLLNACTSVYEVGKLPVENRRQVFAVKQITSWTDTPDEMDSRLAAESCKGLQKLFPNVSQVYGPYWEQAIEYCILLWSQASRDSLEDRLPYLHASLKLITTLESMTGSNDDLDDTLIVNAERVSSALIDLLTIPREENTQASEIVDALLCRRIAKVPLAHVKNISELYGVIASDSRDMQTAAFDILHKALPAAQEQLSVDILLEKRGT
jgi:hypothetical protein